MRSHASATIIPAALSAILASACYFPAFIPYVTGMTLDVDELVLAADGDARITATLRPGIAVSETAVVEWEWEIRDPSVADIFEPAPHLGRESSTVAVLAWSPGETVFTVRASTGGVSVEASGRIVVE